MQTPIKVGIHQPNFAPWLPYFKKMEQCDVFVFLTECQYEKNNFQNRFQYDGRWNTCRVPKKPLDCMIADKEYVDFAADFAKIISHPQNKPIRNELQTTVDNVTAWGDRENFLADINISMILSIYNRLHEAGILLKPLPKCVIDKPTELTGTARLVDIIKTHNGTQYVSGASGGRYMDMSMMYDNGISVTPYICDEQYKVCSLECLSTSSLNT